MRIQHNLLSLAAFNYLFGAETRLSKTLEKLSSGYRINRAADDAAGLAVSEKMRAQITGLKQAHINSSNGISVVQTAEGSLAESHAILQRMGELAVESMNGIYEPEDRQKLDDEYQQLLEELDRISESTNFNGIKLLDGSLEKKAYTQEPVNVLADRTSEILAGVRTAEASLSQRNRAIESYRSTLASGPATTIPAGGDFAITGDGVYEIADGFTGKITIAAGAKVTLTQATPATALKNVSVQCGAGTELTIQDLNIENSDDINAIDFTGAGNKINIEGNNKIISTAQAVHINGVIYDHVEKAVIHSGVGTELTIDGAGVLESETGASISTSTVGSIGADCAVIGGNSGESGGKITVVGSTLKVKSGDLSSGAGIGGGRNGDGGDIFIKGGNLDIIGASGAGIGGGDGHIFSSSNYSGGGAGNIVIEGGIIQAQGVTGAAIGGGYSGNGGSIKILNDAKVTAENRSMGAAIGSGTGAVKACKIAILGGDIVAKTAGSGAAIGGGSAITGIELDGTRSCSGDDGGVISIEGGKIVASNSQDGAAIGGGRYSDGGKILISGGDITVKNTNAFTKGAAIGGGGGCYDEFGTGADKDSIFGPGSGAHFTMTGGKLDIEGGWIGGGADKDTCDYGLDGTTLRTGGSITFNPPYIFPTVPPSHFDTPIHPAPLPDITVPVPPQPDDDDEKFNEGGLILQIGTNNEEYDKLHIYIDDMSTRGLMVAGTNILNIENAEEASDWVRYAIGRVSENRGRLGAYQNRLEHNINGLTVAEENMTAAESRLRDADMAKEMASFTMENVIAQAAQAMLAQANQKPNDVLALLK